jgi:hypothetical protein
MAQSQQARGNNRGGSEQTEFWKQWMNGCDYIALRFAKTAPAATSYIQSKLPANWQSRKWHQQPISYSSSSGGGAAAGTKQAGGGGRGGFRIVLGSAF